MSMDSIAAAPTIEALHEEVDALIAQAKRSLAARGGEFERFRARDAFGAGEAIGAAFRRSGRQTRAAAALAATIAALVEAVALPMRHSSPGRS